LPIYVQIRLAARDDADPGPRTAGIDDAVEGVGADESRRGRTLEFVESRLLAELVELVADVEAAGRHVEFGVDDPDAVERGIDGGRRLDVVLDALDRRPCAGEA